MVDDWYEIENDSTIPIYLNVTEFARKIDDAVEQMDVD